VESARPGSPGVGRFRTVSTSLPDVTLHSATVVLPIGAPPIRNGAVLVEHGRILAVAEREELLRLRPGAAERAWRGILAPGLINAHTHLNWSHCAHFFGNGKPFAEWIQGFPPVIASMTPDGWRDAAMAGVAGMLRTGTTAAADVVTGASALTALTDAGLVGVSYLEAVLQSETTWPSARDEWYAALDAASAAGNVVGVSPHTPYTLDTFVLAELARAARGRGLRLHPHGAESVDEVAFVATGSGQFAEWARAGGLELSLVGRGAGRTPIAELDAVGLLGPDTHVAHGVHVSAADRRLLRERKTVVALCPRSNARLACGAAPVAAYRAEGNLVAVGTDSLTSVESLDVLADVSALRELALAQGSPEEGLDRWLIEAATAGGARALGRDDVGTLRPGGRADFAVFDVRGVGSRATDVDPYTALATGGAGSCIATVVAGDARFTA
jgi:cytosine/adenosine deaminase-related metal-dependent hydrolase